jgi:hypothetical protein
VLARDSRRLGALRDIQQWFDVEDTDLRAVSRSAMRRALDAAVVDLVTNATLQGQSRILARGERDRERRLANALRVKFFRPIVKIVRGQEDELRSLGPIRYPWRRTNTTALATDAHSVAKLVSRKAHVFIRIGMHGQFVARFHAAADELVQSTTAKGAYRGNGVKATKAIALALSEARLVVSALDAMVCAVLEPEDRRLTEWRALLRAFRRPIGS